MTAELSLDDKDELCGEGEFQRAQEEHARHLWPGPCIVFLFEEGSNVSKVMTFLGRLFSFISSCLLVSVTEALVQLK